MDNTSKKEQSSARARKEESKGKHEISFLLNGKGTSGTSGGGNSRQSSSRNKGNSLGLIKVAELSSDERRRLCAECVKVFAQPADLRKQYVIAT